jgi:hypothetical protein
MTITTKPPIEARVLLEAGRIMAEKGIVPGLKRLNPAAGRKLVRHYSYMGRGQRELKAGCDFGKSSNARLSSFWDADFGLQLSLKRFDDIEDGIAGEVFEEEITRQEGQLFDLLRGMRSMYCNVNIREAHWALEMFLSPDFSDLGFFRFQHRLDKPTTSGRETLLEVKLEFQSVTVERFRLDYLLPNAPEQIGYRMLCDGFIRESVRRLPLPSDAACLLRGFLLDEGE